MEQLLGILAEIKPGVDFSSENDLVATGVMDSLTIIELVPMLEDVYGICIGMECLVPENFASAEAILHMVECLKK